MFSAKINRLVLEAGTAAIDVVDGRRIVEHADPVIRINPGWLAGHGLDEVLQADGGLVLDSAGEYRYARRAEVGDGFAVYERI
jgi:hypothetical protein